MDIAEIRILEGPNVFLLKPAVKVEVVATASERVTLGDRLAHAVASNSVRDIATAWDRLISHLCEVSGVPRAETVLLEMDETDHLGLAFAWTHRPFARALVEATRAIMLGESASVHPFEPTLMAAAKEPVDPPEMITDQDRAMFSIAITGTNGKTTTTRLLAHIARTAGRRVGWSSSSGVYLDGEMIEDGDYSGPSGAGQVLQHTGLDLAILETARGGILLKGLGYESNDVSVFTNVSADHLGLNGVHTVETLAAVKSVVCRVTREDGVAVVNADDDLVLGATSDIRAKRCLVTQRADDSRIRQHVAAGGRVVAREAESIVAVHGKDELLRVQIADIPICFGGRARHQVENAMCSIGAALASKLPPDAILEAVTTFGSKPDHNPGRLNVLDLDDYTVILDYAHNEAGLRRLIAFGRELGGEDQRLIAVIGSAGDRDPHLLRSLGRIAAESSDHVIAKGTERYLRGIQRDELMRLYQEGAADHPDTPYEEVHDETAAVRRIVEMARPGDVFVLMFQELLTEVETLLRTDPRS